MLDRLRHRVRRWERRTRSADPGFAVAPARRWAGLPDTPCHHSRDANRVRDGRHRLDRVSFAAHFDTMMFGRRGHPETGTLVPACAQHSALDPAENAGLTVLSPMPTVRRGGGPAAGGSGRR